MKVNVFLRSNVSPLGDILGLLQCLLGKNLLNLESSLFFFFNILILVDDNELLVAALMDLSGWLLGMRITLTCLRFDLDNTDSLLG